jgi:hypothetical protein
VVPRRLDWSITALICAAIQFTPPSFIIDFLFITRNAET